jgi:hypothetical protein
MTDNNTGTEADTIQVIVNTSLPIVNPGPNQTITLPTALTLNGSATGQAGHTISTHTWSVISGPNSPTIISPSNYTTSVTGIIAGTYTFRLTATDDASNVGTGDVVIIVNAAVTSAGCLVFPYPIIFK